MAAVQWEGSTQILNLQGFLLDMNYPVLVVVVSSDRAVCWTCKIMEKLQFVHCAIVFIFQIHLPEFRNISSDCDGTCLDELTI